MREEAMESKVEIGSQTDPGLIRSKNEDAIRVLPPPEGAHHKGYLLLVADGLGGHFGGEIASNFVVDEVGKEYFSDPSRPVRTCLLRAVEKANAELYQRAANTGMATTLVGAVIRGRELHVVNVGDSRAYLLRGRKLRQITQDHSLVSEQVRRKLLSPEEAKRMGYRHVITRALGTEPTVEVDYFRCKLRPGDVVLLCSDGLTDVVDDKQIYDVVVANPPQEAAHKLIDLANERGGPDNISVIVAKIPEATKAFEMLSTSARTISFLAGAFILFGVLIALVGYWLLSHMLNLANPSYLPHPGPILVYTSTKQDLIKLFGYPSWEELLSQNGYKELKSEMKLYPYPEARGYYLAGVVKESPQGDENVGYILRLQVGEGETTVRCAKVEEGAVFEPSFIPGKGDIVTVYGFGSHGTVDRSPREIEAFLVDVGKWWGWKWGTWYKREVEPRPWWIYSVLDKSPYSVVDDYRRYGSPGDKIVAYGHWSGYYFRPEKIYRWDKNKEAYVLVNE